MPRPNRPRTIAAESNLAERVRVEREARQWTPAELARQMTNAGCPIQTSAIYKLEAAERRITVDELVGLSRAFGIATEELLTPTRAERFELRHPLTVDAMRYGDTPAPVLAWIAENGGTARLSGDSLIIDSPLEPATAHPGDWVVRDADDFHAIDAATFAKTWEPVGMTAKGA